jgi:hypothetical protein
MLMNSVQFSLAVQLLHFTGDFGDKRQKNKNKLMFSRITQRW